jgi:hypothetical protein
MIISVLLCLLSLEAFVRFVIDDGLVYELEMWKYARQVKTRATEDDIGHKHLPNVQAKLMRVGVRTNEYGFRGPEIEKVAGPGVARIAFVGDSLTFGWGVKEDETFANRVLKTLSKRGYKVDGFNLGIGNYNTSQELALFKAKGSELRPNIIVLNYFINDAEPTPNYEGRTWLDWNSAAWVVVKYRIDMLTRTREPNLDWSHYYKNLYKPGAIGWEQTQKAISAFKKHADDIGAKLIVFHLPELHQLKPYPFQGVSDVVRAAFSRYGIKVIDTIDSVEHMDPPSLWVTVPDPHPNGKANSAFAGKMVTEILPIIDDLCRTKGKGCRR